MNIKATRFVMSLRGLSPTEKSVLYAMAGHADYKNCEATMGMQTLADAAGLEIRTSASEVVTRLLDYGVIKTVGGRSGGRRPSIYTFTFDVNRDSGITVEEPNRSPEPTDEPSNRRPQPTVKESNRRPSEPQPSSEGAPTVVPSRHEGFKGLKERQREGQKTASLSSNTKAGQAEHPQVKLIVKAVDRAEPNAQISSFDRKDLSKLLYKNQPLPDAKVVKASIKYVTGMNDLDLKKAGMFLAGKLIEMVENNDEDAAREESARQQAAVAIEANRTERDALLAEIARENELAEAQKDDPFGEQLATKVAA